MSAVEASKVQDVERVATVTALPTRAATAAPAVSRVNRAAVADLIQPPDLWSDDRPSLRKVFLYGVYGRWTAVDGPVRFMGAAYATVVVLPLTAVLYTAGWLLERFPRLLVAAVLVALVILAF